MMMAVTLQVLLFVGCLSSLTQCQTSLTQSDKDELLLAHNYFRSIVSPTAANMQRMVWNDELATVAQDYADNCIFDHNDDRTSQQNTYSYVGENLAIHTSSNVNYTNMVQGWYDEVQDYNYGSNQCNPGAVCGHYTQVVWAVSRELGCGVYRCATTVGFRYPNGLNLVCNYGPGGNFNGQSPYMSGTHCSECTENHPYCVSRLCSTTNEAIVGIPESEATTNEATDGITESEATTNEATDGITAAATTSEATDDGILDGDTRLQSSITSTVFLFITAVIIYIF